MDRKVTEFLIDMLHLRIEQNGRIEDLRATLKESEDDLARMVEQEMKLRAELEKFERVEER